MSVTLFLIALVAAVAAFAAFKHRGGTSRSTHAWRINSAGRVLDKLFDSRSGLTPAQCLSYLRKIDPLTFEELVLSAFERRGVRVARNPRYSGDGGIDGIVWIGQVRVLIQMKRYRSFVRAADVLEFARICVAQKAPGFFIHTGRTGKASWAGQSDHVRIISGDRLLRLLDPRAAILSVIGQPANVVGESASLQWHEVEMPRKGSGCGRHLVYRTSAFAMAGHRSSGV